MITNSDKIRFLKKIRKVYSRPRDITRGLHNNYSGLCSAAMYNANTHKEECVSEWFKSVIKEHLNSKSHQYYTECYLFKPGEVEPRIKWLDERIEELRVPLVTCIGNYLKRLLRSN
jgi:hypothetical protein